MIINEQSIREACNHLAETLIAKNKDYGNSVEEQFKEYGDASINLRIEDKLRRLKNLAKSKAYVTSEKKSETVLDAAGYSLLAFILYDRQTLDEPLKTIECNPSPIEQIDGWANFKPGNTITVKYHDQDDQY